jgi:catechol 2,3-dioxygenase-like lactoylglutathione lyase family enzyme
MPAARLRRCSSSSREASSRSPTSCSPTTTAITTDDLDGRLGELSKQGIEPEREPYLVGSTRLCFVRDPDDYRIEIIERSAG